MRSRSRFAAVLTSAGLVLGLGACSIAPADSVSDDFEEHFTQEYPDHVVDARPQADSALPFLGQVQGRVVVAPDTPIEVIDAMLVDLEEFSGTWRVSYTGIGVLANGVGICLAQDRDAERRELREILATTTAELTGTWNCPSPNVTDPRADYQAPDIAALLADAELVTGAAREGSQSAGPLPVIGMVNERRGRVDTTWEQLAATGELADTLSWLHQSIGTRSWSIEGDRLVITIEPTTDTDQFAAEVTQRLGPASTLTVDVITEAGDGTAERDPVDTSQLADALRDAIPDARVTGYSWGLRVSLPGTDQLDAAAAVVADFHRDDSHRDDSHPAIPVIIGASTTSGQVELPANQQIEYRMEAGEQRYLPLVHALIEAPGVSRGWVSDPAAGPPAISITVQDAATVAALKPILPTGSSLTVAGITQYRTIEFIVADQITAADISSNHVNFDADEIVDLWNAAPSGD